MGIRIRKNNYRHQNGFVEKSAKPILSRPQPLWEAVHPSVRPWEPPHWRNAGRGRPSTASRGKETGISLS